tara:strand:+ start:181 stop:459 length:279 start_codon:yes stop_codon:yes gene_type:complete
MKITKRQLKQIIKEEITNVLEDSGTEQLESFPPEVQMAMKKQNRYLQQVRNSGGDVFDHIDGVIAQVNKTLKPEHADLADDIANYYYVHTDY